MLPFKVINQSRRQSADKIIDEKRGISEEASSQAVLQGEGKYSVVVSLEHDVMDNKNVADEVAGMQNLKVADNSSETEQGVTDQDECSPKGREKSIPMEDFTSGLSQDGIDNNLERTNRENKTVLSSSCRDNTSHVSEHVFEYESSLNSESTSTNWIPGTIPVEGENSGSFGDSKGRFLSDESLLFLRVTAVVSLISITGLVLAITTWIMIRH